jgi:uncharacterized repeat protein (TIGR02543 family)
MRKFIRRKYMNKKKNYITKVMAILLTCILFITGIEIENVSAFWNKDEDNDNRRNAMVTMELMHCYHKDTHYDNNGRHIYSESVINEDKAGWLADTKNNPKKKSSVNTRIIQPGVLGNTQAGLECIDTNKYFYEYTLTYVESELVDYVLITQPEITHYSDNDSKRPADLREEHVRMYWIGSYNKSMTEVTGKWTENGYDENDTDIGWWDFLYESFPTINTQLSHQTWETIGDHEAFQNNKSFVFTKTMGENGMEFIFLLEGTKTLNTNDGSFYDITQDDKSEAAANHRDLISTGVAPGYGQHVNAIIGIVFYNTVQFNANGGTLADNSVYTLHTYKDSKQAKAYVLHADGSGNWVDGAVDISNPKYGNVSVKAPTRYGYKFCGWYAAETGTDGSLKYDTNGNIICTDVPLYDVNGKAVLTYTDNSGQTKASPYFGSNGNWIYRGNVTAVAKWEYMGAYTVHFEKNDNDSGSTKATGSMSDEVFTYDESKALPANGFSRVGYTFAGWNRSADGTADNGSNYRDKAVVKNLTLIPGGTATLYAQWKPLEYTLTFDYSKPGNATGTVTGADEASRKVTFDSSIGRLPEPQLTGWVFEGWCVDGTIVNGSYTGGTRLNGDDIWHYTSDKTAFARWTPVKYEVRLHSSVPDEALGTLVKPSDSGLTASGWTWKENEYYSAVFTYDTESLLPAAPDTYSIVYTAGGQDTTEYAISGWYKNSLLSDYTGGGEIKKWNLSAAGGAVIDLYPSWRDTSAPVIDVTPAHTVNPDADNDAVRSIDITITVTEHGSGLRTDNSYEYGFSASASALPSEWESYGSASSPSGFTTSLPDLGASMDGYYYLWVRQVMDNSGSLSVSPSALATVNSCHVYGIYVFDNTAPSGKTEYTENNITLGLYNDTITDSPYAVMTIHDPHDDIAGIEGYVLRVSDAADPSNSVDLAFTPDDGTGTYICRFNLYDSLLGAENIEQVRMCIVSKDKLGNEATIPITRYDFGTLQTGAAIRAEDIGYRDVENADEYVYERDNFRVEAYIEAVTGGTQFKAGQWGMVRIYTFGYVDEVEIDFGSLMNYYNPQYDRLPTLIKTTIDSRLSLMHRHEFSVPLYCTDSSFNDTKVIGYKKGGMEQRYVVYNVKGSILDDIRTILKYKIY